MLFTQHPGQVPFLNQTLDDVLRETVGLVREIAPVEHHRHSRKLPLAAQGILAAAHFPGVAVGTFQGARGPDGRRQHVAGTHPGGQPQPQFGQIGQMQQMPGRVFCLFPGKPAGDMAQGIRSLVAKTGGILRPADTKRIHHQDDCAFHDSHSLAKSSFKARLTMVWNRCSASR